MADALLDLVGVREVNVHEAPTEFVLTGFLHAAHLTIHFSSLSECACLILMSGCACTFEGDTKP